MKTFLLAVVAFGICVIPVVGWLPWQNKHSEAHRAPARFTFLLTLAAASIALILLWLWLAMRVR
jgi:hypothetical protein